jgi:hypothetical protein
MCVTGQRPSWFSETSMLVLCYKYTRMIGDVEFSFYKECSLFHFSKENTLRFLFTFMTNKITIF